MIASGIRIGTAAVTTRGMVEEDMKNIADIIDIVLNDAVYDKNVLRTRVRNLCNKYPIYK